MLKLYEIRQNQLDNAKLFSNRLSALDSLIPEKIAYLEIGVLAGDYSEEVIKRKNPSMSVLLDAYGSEFEYSKLDNRITKNNHLSFVKNRFKDYNNVQILNGRSEVVLPIKDQKFDYIYIDADHSYFFVLRDLLNAKVMISKNGVIGLNDYMAIGHSDGKEYEVIYAVNKFLHDNPEFEVIGFAMNQDMYSDIYIKRKS